jgi:hypothetical protein
MSIYSETPIETNKPRDLDQEIETKTKELAQLRAARRRAIKHPTDPDDVWIFHSKNIVKVLNEIHGGAGWTVKRVQQDFYRGKFPPDVVWKYGRRTLCSTPRLLRELPARLIAFEAAKTAAKLAAKQAAKNQA